MRVHTAAELKILLASDAPMDQEKVQHICYYVFDRFVKDGQYYNRHMWRLIFRIVYGEPPTGRDDARWDQLLWKQTGEGYCALTTVGLYIKGRRRC